MHSPYTFCVSCACIHAFGTRIVISIAFRKQLENKVKSVTHTFATAQRPCTSSRMSATDRVFTFPVLGCSTMMISCLDLEVSKTSQGFFSSILLSCIDSLSVLYRTQWDFFFFFFFFFYIHLTPHSPTGMAGGSIRTPTRGANYIQSQEEAKGETGNRK